MVHSWFSPRSGIWLVIFRLQVLRAANGGREHIRRSCNTIRSAQEPDRQIVHPAVEDHAEGIRHSAGLEDCDLAAILVARREEIALPDRNQDRRAWAVDVSEVRREWGVGIAAQTLQDRRDGGWNRDCVTARTSTRRAVLRGLDSEAVGSGPGRNTGNRGPAKQSGQS